MGARVDTTAFSTTTSWNHTISSGNDRLLLVYVGIFGNGAAPSGVTYGGVAMTFLGRSTTAPGGGSGRDTYVYSLANPAVGVATVAVQGGSSHGTSGSVSLVGAAGIAEMRTHEQTGILNAAQLSSIGGEDDVTIFSINPRSDTPPRLVDGGGASYVGNLASSNIHMMFAHRDGAGGPVRFEWGGVQDAFSMSAVRVLPAVSHFPGDLHRVPLTPGQDVNAWGFSSTYWYTQKVHGFTPDRLRRSIKRVTVQVVMSGNGDGRVELWTDSKNPATRIWRSDLFTTGGVKTFDNINIRVPDNQPLYVLVGGGTFGGGHHARHLSVAFGGENMRYSDRNNESVQTQFGLPMFYEVEVEPSGVRSSVVGLATVLGNVGGGKVPFEGRADGRSTARASHQRLLVPTSGAVLHPNESRTGSAITRPDDSTRLGSAAGAIRGPW